MAGICLRGGVHKKMGRSGVFCQTPLGDDDSDDGDDDSDDDSGDGNDDDDVRMTVVGWDDLSGSPH